MNQNQFFFPAHIVGETLQIKGMFDV